jgi:hypothetical protein
MRRPRLLAIALAVVLLVGAAGGAYGIWYLFLKPGGPPAVALSSANPGSTAAATAIVSGASPAGGEGTWTVDTSIGSFADFTSSFVSYRVPEQLATIGAKPTSFIVLSVADEGTMELQLFFTQT